MVRRGFGDETWRLAREGNVEALRHAAELLGEDVAYDAQRARAFALAVEGHADDALAELNDGWTEDWPFPTMYAVDVARIRYLAGDYDHALTALALALRGARHHDGTASALAAACVRKRPALWLAALRAGVSGGTPAQRVRAAAAVVAARLGRDP